MKIPINTENHAVCAKCGGRCCKRGSCAYHPSDFPEEVLTDADKLIDLLKDGRYTIDYVYTSIVCKDIYYIRPRRFAIEYLTSFRDDKSVYTNVPAIKYLTESKLEPTIIVGFSEKGYGCTLLTSHGCSLPYEERPFEGRNLIPVQKGECKPIHEYDDIIDAWEPYQDILINVRDTLRPVSY